MSHFSVAVQAQRLADSHQKQEKLIQPCNKCEGRSYSMCAHLDPQEQEQLVAIMKAITVEPRHSIFDETDPAEYVYNVTSGAVKIYKLLPDGRRQITGFLFQGDFLGLTHNDTYAYSAEALTETTLCRFSRHQIEALLESMPHLEQRLLFMASHELAAAQDQMVLLGRKSARERVVSFLLMLSNNAARHGRSPNLISLPMIRSDIGDYLGLTIETVSRVFTALKKQKLIQFLDEKQIQLLKLITLQEIAAGLQS